MNKAEEIEEKKRRDTEKEVVDALKELGVPPTFRKFCTLSYIFI